MIESKEHDKLFADLEALNEQQIEVGLAAGVLHRAIGRVTETIGGKEPTDYNCEPPSSSL
jgi:hypothetical protein